MCHTCNDGRVQAGDAIHTFRRRGGRTSASSQAALDRLAPRLCLAPAALDDLPAAFGRRAPLALEIGFGMGETTAAMAAAEPGVDLLAVEIHRAGVAALLRRLDVAGLTNVRVVEGDAVEVLDRLAPASLVEVRVFFPDPWPKARHTKRRLLSPSFCAAVRDRLVVGGRLHVATDWAPYAGPAAEAMATVLDVRRVPRPSGRPTTRFEQRGLDAGRPAHDLIGVRRA